jgi:hypothetical protein
MADVGAIGKTRQNDAQGYAFRSVEDVMNVCSPIFARHGVTITPQYEIHALETDTNGNKRLTRSTVLLTLHVHADDGSALDPPIKTVGEGWDFGGDKATNKAMSAALKYALFHGLCVAYAEMPDNDAPMPVGYTVEQEQGASRIGSALGAIMAAPEDKLNGYAAIIEQRRQADKYTIEEATELLKAVRARRAELAAGEPTKG